MFGQFSQRLNANEECFYPEDDGGKPPTGSADKPAWKIVIADDEKEVHTMTRMVLGDYTFEGRGVELISAYSGEETVRLVREHPDIAVILLDVVMESDDAGLEAVRAIRRDLKNTLVRIILRTGQPGKAPESRIISGYDINDYKEKTELTLQKLFTTVTSALRAYRDLKIIDNNRRGLKRIIDASAHLFAIQSLGKFARNALTQVLSILNLDDSRLNIRKSAFISSRENGSFNILAGTGKYETLIGRPVTSVVSENVLQHIEHAIREEKSFFTDDVYVGYFATSQGSKHLLYLNGCRAFTELDRSLIEIISSNVAVAFENIALNREIESTQKELIFTLGEVIESRSKETGNHVRRVAELSYLLALKAGLSEDEAELLRLASPMHDVGKVGIPDAILLKPAELSREEFEAVKNHTRIGYDILKSSRRRLLSAAGYAAQQHHERWDGRGYPQGLRGEEIHIFGRITALTDVFDALIHKRIYKEAWNKDRVLEYIRKESGKQFDPGLADIILNNSADFFAIIDKYPDTAGPD